MKHRILIIILSCLPGFIPGLIAQSVYVGMDGDDGNPGTFGSPLKNLQTAVELLEPGDTLFILEGTYRQKVKKNFLRGEAGSPIVITAFPGHRVILDGTVEITGPWELYEGNIYKTMLDTLIWQLFVDDKMMTSARWPNAEDWTPDMWNTDKTWGKQAAGSSYGHFMDDGTKNLAGTGKDFTGAIAIMNIGSWLSFAEKVDNHGAGNPDFTYTPHFPESAYHHKITAGRYFFEAAMACLDVANEWYFNPDSRELFLYPDNGLDPTGRNISGKTVTYSMEFNEARYLEIRNIDFFGCTVKLEYTRHSSLVNCNFLYPSYSQRMLGSIQFAQPTLVSSGHSETDSYNRVINCTFEKTDGSGLKIVGRYDLVENCYFHNIDYSCVGGLNDITVAAVSTKNFTFRYNTIDMGGNSLGVKTGNSCVVEYNKVSNIGFLQHDGSAIQTSSTNLADVMFRRNWITDCIKTALRFDSPWTNPEIYGVWGTMKYNVAWNARPMVPKGDYHTIFHNTAFDNGDFDISIFSDVSHGGVNTHTVTRNNAVNAFSGENATGISPIPGIHDHNWEGIKMTPVMDLKDQLYDPANLDFRPKLGADLVDAGIDQSGVTERYIGIAPDIGAYEFGDSVYWIPGRRFMSASTPIPPNNGTSHYEFVDLIWLEGYRSQSSNIYFGTTEESVESATRESTEFMGNQVNNMFNPGALSAGETYYWRIDAVSGKDTVKGKVWRFTAGLDANPVVYDASFLVYGSKDSTVVLLDSARIRLGTRKAMTGEEGTGTVFMLREGSYPYMIRRNGYRESSGIIELMSDTLLVDTLEYTTYTLSVLLQDKATGEPVRSGEILFDGQVLITDQEGKIVITDVDYGNYPLSATAPGYQPVEVKAEIWSDTTLVIELEGKYLSAGLTVVDRVTGDPLYRAVIRHDDQLVLTGKSGTATMDRILEGYWVYSVEHGDYFALTDSLWITGDTSLVIRMTPRFASIRILVSDGSGPIAGALVELNEIQSNFTGADGIVLFYKKQARMEYFFTVSKEPYPTVSGTLFLETDTLVNINLEMETGIDGKAVSGIRFFPNPASEIIFISGGEELAGISILNPEGRLLQIMKAKGRYGYLDVSGLSEGWYILRFLTAKGLEYKEVLIAR